ncbi:SusC/RagA family TonB-linked outer membrane protein [Flavobacterium pedocola]
MRSKFKWIFALLLAFSMQFSFAQEKTITGTVTEGGMPLPGVSVVVKGTTRGAQTDMDGNYTIKAKNGESLVFSFIGMKDQTLVVGAASKMNVVMQPQATQLEDVVVSVGVFKKDVNKITSAISTVAGEEFVKQAPSLSFQNALQGKAAGVQVTARNGQPGQGGYVTVRGNVSITGGYSGATYVVDGVFVSESEATAIAPQDVESLVVLKDGAAAAIYGSRGGNGVVVITTRRGKLATKTSFEINNSFGFTERIKDPFRLMNVDEKIQYETELGDGNIIGMTPAQLEIARGYNVDWQDELLRKGSLHNFTFSVTSGGENTNHFFSIGYNKDTGIIDNIDGYNRITSAYNGESKLNNYLKFGLNVRGSYETNTLPRDRYNAQNPFAAMMWYNPYEPVYDRDPNTGELILDVNGQPSYNLTHTGFPIAEAMINNPEETRFFRGYARPYMDVNILKNLVFTTRLGLNYERYQREYFVKPGSVLDGYVGDPSAPGSKTDNGWDNLDLQWTNILNYKFTVAENHNFNAIAMYDYQKINFRSHTQTRKGFIGDFPTSGTTPTAAGVARTEELQYGIFGNLDYDYKGKYLLSLYGRHDNSSLLGAETNGAFAKGASAGWVVTKDFFTSSQYLNYLKLRASWGQLNNTNGATRYGVIDTFSSTNYAGVPSTILNGSRIGNPELKFEQVEKLDLGFESRMFNDRLALTMSYFKDKRSDFLYADVTPGEGFALTRNVGDWEAKGIEVELKGFAIKKQDMNLSFYVNAAQFDRNINSLNPPFSDEILRGYTTNKVGYAPDTFFLVRYAGVDSATGEALYYDVDGNITNVYSTANRVLLKDKTPYAKYEGGFGMEFSYKGFDLSTDFVFKQGNYIYNLRYRDLLSDGVAVYDNQVTEALDYWTPTNTGASQPAPIQLNGGVDTNQDSDRWLQDGSYIRFRNLNVGYTFGKNVLKNLPLESVRFYTQIQNIYTWSKFQGDPEIGIGNAESGTVVPGTYAGYSYPNTKSFLFGINVKF